MTPPGNLVFGRRRFMQALAPPDGTLGVPPTLCPDIGIATATITGGGGTLNPSETIQNPAVAIVLL